MTSAEKYVTAAYLIFLAVVLAYVVIFATKLSRLDRELAELTALAGAAKRPAAKPPVREADQGKGSGETGRFPQLPGETQGKGAAKPPVREADQGKGSGETGRFPQLPGETQGKRSGETGRFPQLPGAPGTTSARQTGSSPEGEPLG